MDRTTLHYSFGVSMMNQPKKAAEAFAIGAIAAGVIAFGFGAPANAAGKTLEAEGCYTQFWNTAWGQGCSSATKNAVYDSEVNCTGADGNRWLTVGRAKGSTSFHSGTDCFWGISDAWIRV
ncbi:hypothetical protein O7631_18240 [Micromonospora sp. WMMD967]|uniref:hypothetical protein n=1 Tax=Micromonospora sp. WMMD967 TaxID=3016101 RepID=UPI002417F729|nr:hypothetical protein [Micromonospora sp. WMMD967]MDG4838459.1 hypothetical protein [Micromonospora sp. WMMD967]